MPDFVHLHVHSGLSLGEGVSSMRDLVDKAASLEMKALALTDRDRLMNIDAFLSYAGGKGVKPIVGLETPVFTETGFMAGRIVLLATDREGLANLKAISSLSFVRKEKQIPGETLTSIRTLERHRKGVIALSGGDMGLFSPLFVSDEKSMRKKAQFFEELFEGRFYYELVRHGYPVQEKINRRIIEIAPLDRLVVANDVRFAAAADARAYSLISRLDGAEETGREQWLKSASEMAEMFPDMPAALEKSVEIAGMCEELSPEKRQVFMPAGPDDMEILRGKVLAALKKNGFEKNARYVAQVEKELDLIERCNFTKRLLVIADIMEFTRKKGIMTGIGRGSACESLVCYLLGVTKVNPMKWRGLFFERFLNPDRVSMPDIDIDVDAGRRAEVLAYVREKYGDDHVAGIPVISAYKGRSAIRAAALLMESEGTEISDRLLSSLSATVEKMQAKSGKSLAALLAEGAFSYYAGESRKFYDCLRYAALLENIPNGFGLHPAGVLINDMLDRDATMLLKKEQAVVQRDAADLEKDASYLKIDLLSSHVLAVIERTLQLLGEQGKDVPDVNHLQLDNAKAYEFYAKGDGVCIFQMEGATASESAMRIRPRNFTELIAWTAITRPGAQKIIDSYVARAKGEEPILYYGLDEKLQPILAETRGLVLYQEQIMQIAIQVAGYDMAKADALQHAVSKKNPEELKAHRETFISGAVENGVEKATAERLFGVLENFTGYGFNKAHAIAYAYTSYITAWLKAEYPAEFLLANLEMGVRSPLKHQQRIEWASQNGMLSLPDILASEKESRIRDGRILLGLSSIRGIPEKAVNDLLTLRKTWHDDEPADLSDFLSRSPSFNRNFLASLTNAGAIDNFIGGADKRPVVMQNLDAIIEAAAKKRSGHTANFEKDERFPFLGIEKVQEEFFANVQRGIVESEHRIPLRDVAERNFEGSYALVKISGLVREKNGDFLCIMKDDTGELPVRIRASDWERLAPRNAPVSPVLQEGRHELPFAPDMKKAFSEGKQVFRVALGASEDGFRIRAAEMIRKPKFYTLLKFPVSCDVREAEEALDLIAGKYAGADPANTEVYYIDYGDRMPPRALLLEDSQNARDAMERWKTRMENPSMHHNKPM